MSLLLAGCGEAVPERVAPIQPTIVSLNPCADAILAELAAPEQLLAISHYSHDPAASSMPLAQARQFPITGGTVEEVLALNADVVVAGSFLPPATRSAFYRLGVEVETMSIASTIAGSKEQIRQLARLAGNVAGGEALIARIDAALGRSAYGRQPVQTLLWQQGGIVGGPDSLIARLMAHSGFASHSAARGLGQGAYLPLERVLADPPELILSASQERRATHPALQALENVQYASFDPSLFFCGGPSIIAALDRLSTIRQGLE